MIKYFCDTCKKEIKQTEKPSTYTYFELASSLASGEMNMNYVQKVEMYCENCTNELKKKLDLMRKSD